MRDGMTTGERPVRDEDAPPKGRPVVSEDRPSGARAEAVPEHRGQFGDRRVGGLGDRALHGK